MKLRIKTPSARALCHSRSAAAFTLIELLVALALVALVIPVIVAGLRAATLAGEVSERKALAARIAERVLNDHIINSQNQTALNGREKAGPFDFRWTIKDEPWAQLGNATVLNSPNSVNQSVVNSTLIHQLSADVTYTAQGRNFSVHLATLVNESVQQ